MFYFLCDNFIHIITHMTQHTLRHFITIALQMETTISLKGKYHCAHAQCESVLQSLCRHI